jgi:hypothetical protein
MDGAKGATGYLVGYFGSCAKEFLISATFWDIKAALSTLLF